MAGEGVMLVPPYKQGTVAKISVRGTERVALLSGSIWSYATEAGGSGIATGDHVTDIRPLVVLDITEIPLISKDPTAMRRYADSLGDAGRMGAEEVIRWIADQIEAQTKPPRIPEPGLWGVVEASCVHGSARLTWVRKGGDWHPVQPNGLRGPDDWDSLIDPVLIREGVSE